MGFFDIGGDIIKQAEAAANFKLVVPETAKVGKDGGANWTEHGRIVETSGETFTNDTANGKQENLVLTVKMEIDGNENGSGKNTNSTFFSKMRINPAALRTGKGAAKGSQLQKQFTMSQMSIHKLKMLMKAAGIQSDTEDGGWSQVLLAECFPDVGNFSGSASPLIGTAFLFEIRQSESEGKDGRKFTNYDIVQVFDV